MNVVIIPEILNKKSYDWFCNELSIIESNFLLDRNLFDDIDDIDKYNKTLVSYIVYQIIIKNSCLNYFITIAPHFAVIRHQNHRKKDV